MDSLDFCSVVPTDENVDVFYINNLKNANMTFPFFLSNSLVKRAFNKIIQSCQRVLIFLRFTLFPLYKSIDVMYGFCSR